MNVRTIVFWYFRSTILYYTQNIQGEGNKSPVRRRFRGKKNKIELY